MDMVSAYNSVLEDFYSISDCIVVCDLIKTVDVNQNYCKHSILKVSFLPRIFVWSIHCCFETNFKQQGIKLLPSVTQLTNTKFLYIFNVKLRV